VGKRIPRIVLRMAYDELGVGELDDIVVADVESVHFEDMGDGDWWLCVYLPNGERIVWWIEGELRQGEMPSRYRDYDTGELVEGGHGG
jgi:hypothetical protein